MSKSSSLGNPAQSGVGGGFDSAVSACRQAVGLGEGGWNMGDLLNILCGSDPSVVSAAASTQTVYKADRVYFKDKLFNGTSWEDKIFEAGGSAGGGEIMMLSNVSAETAATTLYHEVWHTKQPPGMDWPHPAEDLSLIHI